VTFALAVFSIVFSLFVVVGIHELGHALAARLFNVKIRRISIGFGKPILSYTNKQGTEWVWSLWPLGGYVKLLNSRVETVTKPQFIHCFDKVAIWKRVVILCSGALANVMVAFIALQFYFFSGYQVITPVVKSVIAKSPAAIAGIKAGDQIVAVGDIQTNAWRDVGMQLIKGMGKRDLVIEAKATGNNVTTSQLDLSTWQYSQQHHDLLSSIGIVPHTSTRL
jgi:regulator of sigma E protease